MVATTISPENVFSSKTLPPDWRQFFGGSQDLRGFGLKELPGNDSAGALFGVYLGTELRFTDLLPWGLQPFTFVDLGAMGRNSLQLDRPYFWSPGFGVRWQTSFGSIRTTLAHGFLEKNDPNVNAPKSLSHWQFYFSFGEEF